MNNSDIMITMQNLREQLLSTRVSNDSLSKEIYVSNLIKLNDKGIISDEELREKLLKTDYANSIKTKNIIKAKNYK